MTTNFFYLAVVVSVAIPGFAKGQLQDDLETSTPTRSVGRDNAMVEALLRIPDAKLSHFPQQRDAVKRYLSRLTDQAKLLNTVEQLEVFDDLSPVATVLASKSVSTESIRAARILMKNHGRRFVETALEDSDEHTASAALLSLGYLDSADATKLLIGVLEDETRSLGIRTAAAKSLGKMPRGQRELLDLVKAEKIAGLDFTIADVLLGSNLVEIRNEAAKYVVPPITSNNEAIPPISQLLEMRGSAEKGKVVFETIGTCNKCHKVSGRGQTVGPDLSEIGSKLSREDVYAAILNPSAAISHGYEAYSLLTGAGVILTGTLVNQTDAAVTIRTSEAIDTTIDRKNVDELTQQSLSLMPADLQKLMPLQSLIDLVEYLVALRKTEELGPNRTQRRNDQQRGHEPVDALASLDVADGIDLQLFASEPTMANPTSIDVDYLGRVWVCEAVNYRHFQNPNNPERENGDRILVLEDEDHDGKSDKSTVFYQGRDIDSPHGVCVLGSDVIVSAGPIVWVFSDEDGDLRADNKRALFTGIQGVQHDHGVHGFTVGPDQRLYSNFGNEANRICDPSGKPIVDEAGNKVEDARRPYQQGMAFRCNLDGSRFETLGWNFRNNWELCVDSFGTIWQSDNDDDGNRGTRINYVMEFGNYGYRDEKTGDAWNVDRTGIEKDVPSRHWHLNDPGVVPNLLHTGAGSPAGIAIYEGELLPTVFRNQLIHCDPGNNVVRAYPLMQDNAGYSASMVNLVDGVRDHWFRPVDVATAPDGSLFIADWYDPGVGGHGMGDTTRGRIYRASTKTQEQYLVPEPDFKTVEGAARALESPNIATRFVAQRALRSFASAAIPTLTQTAREHPSPRVRARAAWQLAMQGGSAETLVQDLLGDADPDLRIVGIRIARQQKLDLISIAASLVRDPSPQVRRELAIALRHERSPDMPALWAQLAAQHDGSDRWYLEALGIGSDIRAVECFDAWLSLVGKNWNTPSGRDVIWRIRAPKACTYLAKIICSTDSPTEQARYFRAMDFHDPVARGPALETILTAR